MENLLILLIVICVVVFAGFLVGTISAETMLLVSVSVIVANLVVFITG